MSSPFNWIQDMYGDWFLELSPLHSVYQIRPRRLARDQTG